MDYEEEPRKSKVLCGHVRGWFGGLALLMLADSFLLFLAQDPGWATAILILIHLLLGFGLLVMVATWGVRTWRNRRLTVRPRSLLLRTAFLLLVLSSLLGAILPITGTFGWGQTILRAHVSTAGFATLLSLIFVYRYGPRLTRSVGTKAVVGALVLLCLAGTIAFPEMAERVWGQKVDLKQFFPSRAATADGRLIPAGEIGNSRYCGECHEQIYRQWRSSQHHLASFGNIFYRRAALYTIERKGAIAFRFCAGCHDPALLFSGQAEQPEEIDVEASAALEGLSCVGCHAVRGISNSGTASYVIERPKQFPFANHNNPKLRAVNKLLIRLKPNVHRRSFLRPFHSEGEFCGACHKITIEAAVNEFRWVRGYSEYDDWQQSGYSGQAATPFYTSEEPKRCQDCHMPAVPSMDVVEVGRGFVHDHRFLGSNTAVPLLRGDPEQFELVRRFLTQEPVSIDIFAVTEGERFAPSDRHEPGGLWMPLDRAQPFVKPSQMVVVDVVVRNRNVGHRFPAATLDLWDVWLEFTVTDADGWTIFSSGHLVDQGEVDPQAHFLRNRPLDRHGRPTAQKSNRFDTVTIVYDSSIPPGQADVVHYQFRVPEDARGPLTLRSRLNYRKYNPSFARWVFGGRPASGQEERVSSKVDDRDWVIEDIPLPRLPILTLAGDTQLLAVLGSGRPLHPPAPSHRADALRFNDYGIGLFRQGDYKAAEAAFRKVVELDPQYADGFLNLARVLLAASRTEEAQQMVDTVLRRHPDYSKALFYRAEIALIRGEYAPALGDYERVLEDYPHDRLVRQRAGRAYYLSGRYSEAVEHFKKILQIDPEERGAYYNLMLCYQALGDSVQADQSHKRYEEYRPDFSIKQISADYRTRHKTDSIEAEPVHVHGEWEENQ
ncbi:tetratricopeptide repeat protein [Acidobacteria bacterium AH-259-A15]|nr:tetratricopeptide repeat protein [Acidobacteria bacterium AH-259-A15]